MIALTGCVGPPVLERQVLGYDEVTRKLDEQPLLLNIARLNSFETVHFTSTSSIAATFDWTTTIGVGGQLEESAGTNFFNFNLGASASENPTFSIIPLSGEEFTKRIATPLNDDVIEFLGFQGGVINRVMRMMASGIEVQKPEGQFVRFIENDPRRPREYEEFRRIAAHLQWLNDVELFDLEADPDEMQNLSTEPKKHGDLLLAMNDKMNALIDAEVGVDDGSFLPGEDVDWAATTFDP